VTQAVTASETLIAELDGVRGERGREPAFLVELRGRAADRFVELGFPTPRREEWRFTNVKRIAETPYGIARESSAMPVIEPWAIPGAFRLVLVDGLFTPELSSVDGLPSGVVLTGLADALERSPELVEPHLSRYVGFDDHAFAALNTALFRDGAFLWLPAGAALERPIQLLFATTGRAEPTANLPRNLIVAGGSSEATVVETYAGTRGRTLTCPVTEIVLQSNAQIQHHVIHEEGEDSSHVAIRQASLDRDSSLTSHAITIGGGLVRSDVNARLDGEGANVSLNGLYVTDDRQHVDNQLRVHHTAPHCTSQQLYKGILDGSSRAVFNGRIVVDPGAQKTDAEQSNRNLLLSSDALVHSNPQLEILADDVRCTHGSTVGRLDEDALFYLRSRGIDRAAAESLLTYAFASDMVGRIEVESVRERLEEFLFARLPRGELVREAV
jgi:Fe-S cluster assembly protein SufD